MNNDHLRQLTDSLLEQMPLGIILSDLEGNISFVNRTAEKMRNVRREVLLGRNILDCHSQESRTNVMRAMENIAKNPEVRYRRMVDDTINGKYFINTYAGMINTQNQAIGMAVLSEDVTEKRKLELERATAYQIMQETNNNIRNQYHDLLITSLESIAKLLEARDSYTRYHSRNVCDIATKIYEHRYGIGNEFHNLKIASTLHDIGKIGIPDIILHKAGPLNEDEYNVIKQHSVIAEEILKPLDLGSGISSIVRHHHERYDGRGYPDGLRGNEIPLCSRIIAIADSFDAMNSDRPYRRALPFDQCIDEIARNVGSQFDPEWAEVFLDLARTGSL